MATIKSFTDIPQSKELAEILPLESADMYYDRYGTPNVIDNIVTHKSIKTDKYQHLIPCWSLAALLGVLPQSVRLVGTPKDSYWYCEGVDNNNQWYADSASANNPVDACYKLILKLHELNVL